MEAARASEVQDSTVSQLDALQTQLYVALQTSIDLDTLLALFKEHVQQQVPFDSLHLASNQGQIDISTGALAAHSATFMLETQGVPIGALDFSRSQPFSEQEEALLETLIKPLAFPVYHAIEYKRVVHNSLTDRLTSIGNRAAMEQALEVAWGSAARYQQDLSLLLLDLDHFKQINDRYGHPIGDQVLKMVATLLKQGIRCADQVFRFGGEEFLVILPNTDMLGGFIIAERLRVQIEQTPYLHVEQVINVTASFGLAALKHHEPVHSVLERCDRRLYQAKTAGRNCVCSG